MLKYVKIVYCYLLLIFWKVEPWWRAPMRHWHTKLHKVDRSFLIHFFGWSECWEKFQIFHGSPTKISLFGRSPAYHFVRSRLSSNSNSTTPQFQKNNFKLNFRPKLLTHQSPKVRLGQRDSGHLWSHCRRGYRLCHPACSGEFLVTVKCGWC